MFRVDFATIFIKQSFGWRMGRVWQHRRIPNKKWLVRSLIDEIKDGTQSLAANGEPFVPMPTSTLWITVRHSMREAPFFVIPFPPLARLQASVPARRQDLRDRWQLAHMFEHL